MKTVVALSLLGCLLAAPLSHAEDRPDISGYKRIAIVAAAGGQFEYVRFGLYTRKEDRTVPIPEWGLDDVFYEAMRTLLEQDGRYTISRPALAPAVARRFAGVMIAAHTPVFNSTYPVQQDVVDLGATCGCDAVLAVFRREHVMAYDQFFFTYTEELYGLGLDAHLDSGKTPVLFASYELVLLDIHGGQVVRSAPALTVDPDQQGMPHMMLFDERWPLGVPLSDEQMERMRKRSGTVIRDSMPRALQQVDLLPPPPRPPLRAPMHQ